jgi:hypothetical protein
MFKPLGRAEFGKNKALVLSRRTDGKIVMGIAFVVDDDGERRDMFDNKQTQTFSRDDFEEIANAFQGALDELVRLEVRRN